MKIKSLFTGSVLALLTLGLVLFNGCNQHGGSTATAPAAFQATSVKSAEPTSFNDVAAHLDAGGNFYFYLSTEQWLTGLSTRIASWEKLFADMSTNERDRQQAELGFKVIASLVHNSGVEEVSGVGVSSIATEPGFYRSKAIVHHYKGQDAGFIWSLFGKSAHPLDGLDLLPTTTAFATFSDFDVPKLWSVIENEIKNSGIPNSQKALDDIPKQFKRGTGMDWDKLLASFGGEFGLVVTLDESKMVTVPLPTSEPLDIPEPGIMIVAKMNDDTLFKRLEQVLVQTHMDVTRVNQDGVQMRTVAIPIPLPVEVRPTIAMANGYLFIATSDALVQEALAVKKGTKPGLKSTDEFKHLSNGSPTAGNNFSYISQRFGENVMKIQKQIMEMRSTAANDQGTAKLMQAFANPANARNSYSVGAMTDEGWMAVGNGTQNGAVVAVVVPAAAVGGLLAAIAVPNFVKARGTAQKNTCINNLRQIDGAKEQWALENRKNTGATPKESDIAPYMKNGMPVCPQGGVYTIGAIGTNPTCSIPGHEL